MPVRLDLNSYDVGVNAYLAGSADSTGWPLLDALERNLAAGLPEKGTPDEQRARALLARIRSRLSAAEEVAMTRAALETTASEYNAGLQALAQHVSVELWNATVLKLFEKTMYEARLKAAEART